MSKKKKEKYRAQQQSSQTGVSSSSASIASAPAVPLSAQDPAAVVRKITFDSMEESIRGHEILVQEENRKIEEEQKIKKTLDKKEVDRRLEELRRQLGLKK